MGNLKLNRHPPKAYILLFVHIYSRYTYQVASQELGHYKFPTFPSSHYEITFFIIDQQHNNLTLNKIKSTEQQLRTAV